MTDNSTKNSTQLTEAEATPHTVQGNGAAKVGKYTCQECLNTFEYAGGTLKCPKCATEKPDSLTPIYTEETPSNEMLSKKEFAAGD